MALRMQYYANGQPMGLVDDSELGAAPSDGDPLGAQNRATVMGQRQAAQDAAERAAQRDHEAGLLQAQQNFAANRDVYDSQQRAALQGQALSAHAQSEAAAREQQGYQFDQKAQQDYRDWALRGYLGVEQHQENQRQFDIGTAQKQGQFEATHQAQAERDLQHDYEFEAGRSPSARDVWQEKNKQLDAADSQMFQAQHFQAQAELNKYLQHQQLTMPETQRLQRMQQGVAAVQADLDAGRIDPQTARDAFFQLRTGIDPLQQRQRQAQMTSMEMQDRLHYQQAAKIQQIEEQNAQFEASTFDQRRASFTDSTGATHDFFQHERGKWTQIKKDDPSAHMQKLITDHEKTLDTNNQRTMTRFKGNLHDASREVDNQIKSAKHEAERAAKQDPESPEAKSLAEWASKLDAARDQAIHDRMTARNWTNGANENSLAADLEDLKQEQLDQFRKQLQPQQAKPQGASNAPTPTGALRQNAPPSYYHPNVPQQINPQTGAIEEQPAPQPSVVPPVAMNQGGGSYGAVGAAPTAPAPAVPEVASAIQQLREQAKTLPLMGAPNDGERGAYMDLLDKLERDPGNAEVRDEIRRMRDAMLNRGKKDPRKIPAGGSAPSVRPNGLGMFLDPRAS